MQVTTCWLEQTGLKQTHDSSRSGQEIWSCKPVVGDLTPSLTDNSNPLMGNPSFFSVARPHSCCLLLSQAITRIRKSLHYAYFFKTMGDLFLCATWVWRKIITRLFPSLGGVFYPRSRSWAPAKLKDPVLLSFLCLPGELAAEFSRQLGLKEQARLRAEGITEQSWTMWVLHYVCKMPLAPLTKR